MATDPKRPDPEEIRRQLEKVIRDKEEAIEKMDYHRAADLRAEQTRLGELLRELESGAVLMGRFPGSGEQLSPYKALDERIVYLEQKIVELEKQIKGAKRRGESKPRKRRSL